MAGEADALLEQAQQALEAGDWAVAQSAFQAALEQGESAEALFGLGVTAWWLGDTEASIRSWESAYAAFRRSPDPAQAVLTAFYLCLTYRMSLGNLSASRGWLARAASLVEELGLPELKGWVLLGRAYVANESGHPREGEGWAREAREVARRYGDADLALCALSELGAALVGTGRVEEGAALLDEAMAAALAREAGDLDTVVLISCRTITCCSRGGEVRRATEWIRAAGEFHSRYGSPHLYTTCRTHYGGILFAAGEWAHAEQELEAALKIGRAAEPALHAEALAKLAELRLAQGRVDEAARLLDGYEHDPAATCARAAVHLSCGEPVVASSLLRRRLNEVDEESLEAAVLLDLLSEAKIAQGAPHEAAAQALLLAERGTRTGAQLIVARGERALGRAMVANADAEAAIPHLEAGLAAFRRIDMPFEVGRTRLLLARALAAAEPETAIAEARTALACFEQLGAARDADTAAAFLRSLGVKAARSGPRGIGLLTKRELEVLELLGEGLLNPEIAERLFISRKTVEHHVASVLSKLGLSGRGEATAYALRHLAAERDSATK